MTAKYKKQICLIVSFVTYLNYLTAQFSFADRSIYQEKTPEIFLPYDTSYSFKTINTYAFVDYRLYTNRQMMDDILINYSFNYKNADDTSAYVRYPKNSILLKQYCEFESAKILNKYMGVRRPIISTEDSLLILKELAPLKKQLKDSLITEIKMSEVLYSVFSKYPADLEIITDVLMYHSQHFFSKTMNNCSLMRVFIFDLRQKKVVAYNYKTAYGGENYKWFDPMGFKNSVTQRFKVLIQSLNPYMQANKQF